MGAPNMSIEHLERALEDAEHADAETHKLYNNLGVAQTAAGSYRAALRAHTAEKQACKRLAFRKGANEAHLLDLAIAYRYCGDAMLRVDALQVGLSRKRARSTASSSSRVRKPRRRRAHKGAEESRISSEEVSEDDETRNVRTSSSSSLGRRRTIRDRESIARHAHDQHTRALSTARDAECKGVPGAAVEVQAACAAMTQSALAIAQATRVASDFRLVTQLCVEATVLADRLSDKGVSEEASTSMKLSAAVNLGVALSGLGDKNRAKTVFETAALRACAIEDTLNHIRCVANLAEEASDDGDWQLCMTYVKQWIELARTRQDEGEEGDALRKKGAASFELGQFEGARRALAMAVDLARDENARNEAENNLHVVVAQIEEIESQRERLAELGPRCDAARENGSLLDEVRLRLDAAEAAKGAGNDQAEFSHLERYFELADDSGCRPDTAGIERSRHCSAVANMAEAYWKAKRFADAVKWGMRELAVYEDDVAGQAQAWCNIGVYLDDGGHPDRARVALARSIELAKQSGDDHLRERAEYNMDVIDTEEAGKRLEDGVPGSVVDQVPTSGPQLDGSSSRTAAPAPSVAADQPGDRDDCSVVVESGTPDLGRTKNICPRTSRMNEALDEQAETNHECRTQGPVSGDATSSMGARSSAGKLRYIDLPAIYRRSCASLSRKGKPLQPRNEIIDQLQQLSSSLVLNADADRPVFVNLSANFVDTEDVVALHQALASLPSTAAAVHLDLSMNRLLTSHAIRVVSGTDPSAHNGPFPLEALDLSACAVSVDDLGTLARAMRPLGALCTVKRLDVGKNHLGKSPGSAADVVARLLSQSHHLRHVDLSLNQFPASFLRALAENVERIAASSSHSSSSVEVVSLQLNNRRSPTALLYDEHGTGAPAKYIECVIRALKGLRLLDLRACGASRNTRSALHSTEGRLNSEALDGSHPGRPGIRLQVVSSGVADDADP